MMDKPIMKKKVGIVRAMPNSRVVVLNADSNFIENMVQGFGRIITDRDGETWLKVDARYDWDEVLEYIEGLNE